MSELSGVGLRAHRDWPSAGPPDERLPNVVYAAIFACPPLAALGPLIPGLGPFFGFRLVCLALLPIMVAHRQVVFRRGLTEGLALLATLWVLVGVSSLLWSISPADGAREMLSVSLGMLFSLMLSLSKLPTNTLNALMRNGLQRSGLVPICFQGSCHRRTHAELRFSYKILSLTGTDLVSSASSFSNPNLYGVFLVTFSHRDPLSANESVSAFGQILVCNDVGCLFLATLPHW